MTREEAKQIFIDRGMIEVDGGSIFDGNKWREACRVISEWLEQEPCEDCVSREEVIGELNRLGRNAFKDDTDYDNFFAFVDNLPPVTPTRKKGKWVTNPNKMKGSEIECNKCGVSALSKIGIQVCSNYCPNCGAEMESEE